MLARARLLVCEDVQQQAERSHIQRNEDESPLHHHRLWVAPKLIPGNVAGRRERDQKPREEEIVDGLNEHGGSPEGENCIRAFNATQRCAAPANALSRSTDAKAGAFSRTTRSREGPSIGHPPRSAQDAGSWHADPPRCRA